MNLKLPQYPKFNRGVGKRVIKSILLVLFCTTIAACSSPVQTSSSSATIIRELASTAVASPFATTSTSYHPITWKELNDFLASDHTNWNKYVPGKYTCVNFAMDLVANAKKKGFNAWIVSVEFGPAVPGHAFVGFETTDKGVVWVEPQTDYAYNQVKVGEPLCLKIDPSSCDNWGVVTKILDPAQCDAVTSECWQQ